MAYSGSNKVELSISMDKDSAVRAAFAGLKDIGNGADGFKGSTTQRAAADGSGVIFNQTNNLTMTGQSMPQTMDFSPLIAAAERLEQGVNQLAAVIGKESQDDGQFADWRSQISSLRSGQRDYYSELFGDASAQGTVDSLNLAFMKRENFSKWVNGQLDSVDAVAKWAGLSNSKDHEDWRNDVIAAAARAQKSSGDPLSFMYEAMGAMRDLSGYRQSISARMENEKGMSYYQADIAMRRQEKAEKKAAALAAKQEKAAQQTQQAQQTEAKKNAKAQKDAAKTAEKTQAGQIAQAAEKKAEQAEKRADKAERREQAIQQAQQEETKKSNRSKGTGKAAKQDQAAQQQEKTEEKKSTRSGKRAAQAERQEQAAQQAQKETAKEIEKSSKQAAKNARAAASAQEDEAKSAKKTARSKKQEAREEQKEQASQQAETKQTAKSAKKSAEKAAEQEAAAQQPAAQKKTKAAKQSEPQQAAPTEQTGKGKTTVKTNGDVNIDGAKTANVQGTPGTPKKNQITEEVAKAADDMVRRGGQGGGGQGGGGTPGGTGGGGFDNKNQGGGELYYKTLDELNAMLAEKGFGGKGGIAEDIKTQLAASGSSVSGIAASFNSSGELTAVRIDTKSVELGDAGKGTLSYGIRQTKDEDGNVTGYAWQGGYTGAVSQAKLSEAVSKELARQEKAADKALADTKESRLANRLPQGQLAGVEAAQARYQKDPTAENLKAYYDQAVAAKGAIKDLKEDDFWGKESAKLFAKEDALVRMGTDRNGGLKQWTKEQQDAYNAIEKMQDKMAVGIGGRNTAWSKDMPRMDAMLKDLDASLKATAKAEAQATQAATKAGQARLAEERAADKAAVDDGKKAADAWQQEVGRVTQKASDVMNSTNFSKVPQAMQDALLKAYEEFDKTGISDRGLMEKLQAAADNASTAMKEANRTERDTGRSYESLMGSDQYQRVPKNLREAMEQAAATYNGENGKTHENLQAYAASVKAVQESMQSMDNSKYWAGQQAKLDEYKESLQQMKGKNGGFSEWTQAQQTAFSRAYGKIGEMQKAINSQNATTAGDASKAIGNMTSTLNKSLNDSGRLIDKYNQTVGNELFKGVGDQLQKNLDKAFTAYKADGSVKSANALGTALENVQTAMKGIKSDDTFRVQNERLQTFATKLDTMSQKNGEMDKWSEAQKSSFKDMQGSYAALAQMQGYKLTEGMALPGGGKLTKDMMDNLTKFGTFNAGMQVASQQEAQFKQATAQQKIINDAAKAQQKQIDEQNKAAEQAARAKLAAERKEAAAAEKEAVRDEQRAQNVWQQEVGKVTGAASKAMENKYFNMLSDTTKNGLTSAFDKLDTATGERSSLDELQKATEKANAEIATLQKQEQSLSAAYNKAQGDKLYGKTPEAQRAALERDFKAYKEAPTAESLKAAQDSLRTVQESLGQQKEWANQVKNVTNKANGVMSSPNFAKTPGAVQDELKKRLDEFDKNNTEQSALDSLKAAAEKASDSVKEAAATQRAADQAYRTVQADKMFQTTPQEKRDAVESTKQALEQAPSAENLKAYSDAVKALSDSAKEAAKTEKDTISAFDAARASKQWGNAPEEKRNAAEQAFATYSQDKTAENLQAFSKSVRDVQGAMGAQQDENYWANQTKQLENYREQLNQLATGKNGGMDNWTQAQKDSLKQIQDMQSQMAQAIAGGNKAGTESASKQITDMTKGLEDSLGKSSKLLDQYSKTVSDSLFKGVGDNLKNQLNDAFNNFKADGSVESANALSAALNNVKTAMDGIQSSQAFAQQDQQLQTFATQLYSLSNKNGGFDKWNAAQQDQFRNMQTTYAALQQMQGYQMAPGMSLPGGGTLTDEMMQNMQNMPFSDFKGGMQMARQQTQQFNNMLRAAAPSVGSMGTQVDALSKYLTQMAAPMMMWRRFTNLTKKAAANVAAIDTQMADLRKVTNNTEAEYDNFLTSTGQNAVAVGAKISDLVATTSTFAHMGYSLSESQQLGVTATKFANVGNFQNTTEAADSMIAVIKGFDDLNIGDAELVGDKLTAVANNYAVTADDIATGLQKSASSLNMAGNNVDQSTAMITAIAEVTRDAGAAGSALKVLSARIRGAKTEITDAGESTEGMAESTSKLRDKVKALTNVDGKGGVDIMADEDTFRSTYDIMKDISGKWGQMTDVNQAALLELLAGKVRSNQVAALLSNFDQAEKAMQTSQNAKGTMNQVHQAWMGSVEARKAQFQAAGETLSMTALPAKDLAGLYQMGTGALGIINTMVGNTGSLGTLFSSLAVTSALRSGQGNIAAGWGNIFGLHWNKGGNGPLLTKANAGWINAYNSAYSDAARAINPATGQHYMPEQMKLMAAEAAGGTDSLDKYTKSLYMNTQGTIDATKATGRLGSSIAGFTKNIAVGVGSFVAMQAVMTALNAAVSWFNDNIINRGETLKNQAATSYATYSEAKQEADSLREQTKTAQERINTLTEKESGGGLTSAEQKELDDLRSQVRTLQYKQQIADAKESSSATQAMADWAKSHQHDVATQTTNDFLQAGGFTQVFGRSTDAAGFLLMPLSSIVGTATNGQTLYTSAVDWLFQKGWLTEPMVSAAEWTQGAIEEVTGKKYGPDKELDEDVAAVKAKAEEAYEAYDQITSGKAKGNVGVQYAKANQLYQELLEANEQTAGRAAAALQDNKAYAEIEQKKLAAESAFMSYVGDSGAQAKQLVGEYISAGYTSPVYDQMYSFLGQYLKDRETIDPGSTYDAIRELFADTPLLDAFMQAEELAKQNLLTADKLKDITSEDESGQKTSTGVFMSAVLGLLGVSVGDFSTLVQDRVEKDKQEKSSGGAKAERNAYADRKSAYESTSAAQEAAEKLWKAQGFTGSLDTTSKDYEALVNADDGAYRAAIEYANGGLFFNKDKFDQLVREKYKEELSGLRKDVVSAQRKYAEAATSILEQIPKQGTKEFDVSAYQQGIDAIKKYGSQLSGLAELEAQMGYNMSGYSNWLNNKSGPESGDVFDELGEAANAIREGRNSGKVGTRKFGAAMQYLFGDNFSVNDLTKADIDYITGLSGYVNGKADGEIKEKTLKRIRQNMKEAGILDENFAVATPGMTTDKMAEIFNAKYGTNFNGEFFNGVFRGLNDYIEDESKKYQLSSMLSKEGEDLLAAKDAFGAAVEAYEQGKEGRNSAELAEGVVKAGETLKTALMQYKMKYGSPDEQVEAAEELSKEGKEDPLSLAIEGLSSAISGLASYLKEQQKQKEEEERKFQQSLTDSLEEDSDVLEARAAQEKAEAELQAKKDHYEEVTGKNANELLQSMFPGQTEYTDEQMAQYQDRMQSDIEKQRELNYAQTLRDMEQAYEQITGKSAADLLNSMFPGQDAFTREQTTEWLGRMDQAIFDKRLQDAEAAYQQSTGLNPREALLPGLFPGQDTYSRAQLEQYINAIGEVLKLRNGQADGTNGSVGEDENEPAATTAGQPGGEGESGPVITTTGKTGEGTKIPVVDPELVGDLQATKELATSTLQTVQTASEAMMQSAQTASETAIKSAEETAAATLKGAQDTSDALTKGAQETADATKKGADDTAAATLQGAQATAAATIQGAQDTAAATIQGAQETVAAMKQGMAETTAAMKQGAEDTAAAMLQGTQDTIAAMQKGAEDTAAATLQGAKDTAAATIKGAEETAAATIKGAEEAAALAKEKAAQEAEAEAAATKAEAERMMAQAEVTMSEAQGLKEQTEQEAADALADAQAQKEQMLSDAQAAKEQLLADAQQEAEALKAQTAEEIAAQKAEAEAELQAMREQAEAEIEAQKEQAAAEEAARKAAEEATAEEETKVATEDAEHAEGETFDFGKPTEESKAQGTPETSTATPVLATENATALAAPVATGEPVTEPFDFGKWVTAQLTSLAEALGLKGHEPVDLGSASGVAPVPTDMAYQVNDDGTITFYPGGEPKPAQSGQGVYAQPATSTQPEQVAEDLSDAADGLSELTGQGGIVEISTEKPVWQPNGEPVTTEPELGQGLYDADNNVFYPGGSPETLALKNEVADLEKQYKDVIGEEAADLMHDMFPDMAEGQELTSEQLSDYAMAMREVIAAQQHLNELEAASPEPEPEGGKSIEDQIKEAWGAPALPENMQWIPEMMASFITGMGLVAEPVEPLVTPEDEMHQLATASIEPDTDWDDYIGEAKEAAKAAAEDEMTQLANASLEPDSDQIEAAQAAAKAAAEDEMTQLANAQVEPDTDWDDYVAEAEEIAAKAAATGVAKESDEIEAAEEPEFLTELNPEAVSGLIEESVEALEGAVEINEEAVAATQAAGAAWQSNGAPVTTPKPAATVMQPDGSQVFFPGGTPVYGAPSSGTDEAAKAAATLGLDSGTQVKQAAKAAANSEEYTSALQQALGNVGMTLDDYNEFTEEQQQRLLDAYNGSVDQQAAMQSYLQSTDFAVADVGRKAFHAALGKAGFADAFKNYTDEQKQSLMEAFTEGGFGGLLSLLNSDEFKPSGIRKAGRKQNITGVAKEASIGEPFSNPAHVFDENGNVMGYSYFINGLQFGVNPMNANGQTFSPEQIQDYVDQIAEAGISTVEELEAYDNPENGGLGILGGASQYDMTQWLDETGIIPEIKPTPQQLPTPQDVWTTNGMVVTTSSTDIYGGEHSFDEISDYMGQLANAGISSVEDLLAYDRSENGLGVITDAYQYEDVPGGVSEAWTGNGLEITTNSVDINGGTHTFDEIGDYMEGIFSSGISTVEDLMAYDSPENGGLGIITNAVASAAEDWLKTETASFTEDINRVAEQLGSDNFEIAKTGNADYEADAERVRGNARVFSTQGMDVEQGMTAIATNVAADGTVLSSEDLANYVNSLMQQAKSIDELLDLDNAENGGLGLLTAAAAGDSAEIVDTMQGLTDSLNTTYAGFGVPGSRLAVQTEAESASVQPVAPQTAAEAVGGEGQNSVEVQVTADTSAAQGAIAGLNGMTVTVNVVGDTSGVSDSVDVGGDEGSTGGAKAAKGTRNAGPGTYLVDEEGAELIEHRSEGTYELGTNGGARFVRLNAGDIVHTAAETRRIMKRNGAAKFGGAADGGVQRVQGGSPDTIRRPTTPTDAAIAAMMRVQAERDEEERSRYLATLPMKIIVNWLKKLMDWIPTYLAKLKKKTADLISAADDAIHYLAKNRGIDSAIDNISEEIKANIAAALKYRSFLAGFEIKAGFSPEMIEQMRNGTIDITAFSEEETVKAIQGYQQYWEKLKACLDTIRALNDQMEELSRQKLNNVIDYFDRIDGLLQDQMKSFETLIDLKKQYGQELTTADYASSLDALAQMLENAQTEESTLLKELSEQLGVDGDLVQAVLAGGREVWDAIAEHVAKAEDYGLEELLTEQARTDEEILATPSSRDDMARWEIMNMITGVGGKSYPDIMVGTDLSELLPETLEMTPATDDEIREIGEKLGLVMNDGSEEALKNFETIRSLLTTSWDAPLAIGSETWYQYMSTLESVRERILSTKIEIGEMNDEIASIPLKNLQTGYEYLDDIRKNYEHINSLLEAQGSPKSQSTYRSLISVGMKQIENLQEQNRLIEEQMSQLDPLSEKYGELRDDLSGNLDTIASIRENQEAWNDAIIDLQIDRLRKQNDAYKEQLSLMHALNDLEDARQRRILTYREGEGFVYEADEDALESAQESATDAIYSSLISSLERSKEDNNIYGPLGERLITGSSILDMFGNTLVPVEDMLSGLDFTPYYQSILSGAEQSSLLAGILGSIDMAKLLESAVSGDVNIDLSGMTLNGVNDAQELGDAIIQQLPNYLLQYLYQKGAN